jgi:hypothetical protein
MNAIGHTPTRFTRTGVGTNCILEREFLPKNAHRTSVFDVSIKSVRASITAITWVGKLPTIFGACFLTDPLK